MFVGTTFPQDAGGMHAPSSKPLPHSTAQHSSVNGMSAELKARNWPGRFTDNLDASFNALDWAITF
jgi:hypothetical protein